MWMYEYIHTQEEKTASMQESVFTNPLLARHKIQLLILRAFSPVFSLKVYVPT